MNVLMQAGRDFSILAAIWQHVPAGVVQAASQTAAASSTSRAASLVLWSGLTIAVYAFCRWVFLRSGRNSLLFPGFTSIVGTLALVVGSGHSFADYARETAWINWLLGPAVVAMAVPIFQLRRVVRANLGVLAIVIPVSLGVAASSTMLLLAAAGRPRAEVAAGALKSITSPVAYRLAVDANVPLPFVMAGVLVAGTLGATIGPAMLSWMRVREPRAVGLALGCTSHGIGVAVALGISEAAGTFASLGMSGTAMCAALAVPYVLRWMLGA
jgi:putative effector of murein hydrolase